MKGQFVLSGGPGFCNAVRRTLLSDVTAWAPYEVVVRDNTSCQTDEFLAHRIGLVPFRRVGNGDEMCLEARGPCTVRAKDLVGPGFEAVHPEIELMVLADAAQHLDLTVRFDERPASAHARYATCAAVGMVRVDADRHRVTFETHGDRDPKAVLLEALDHLDARVDRALQALAHKRTYTSMC